MTTNISDQYRVAAIQFEPLLGAQAENIARLLELVETAARDGARLIVLPEMATTGYCWYDRDDIRPYVEPIPGPTTDAFTRLAEQYGCYVVVGMPEVAPHTGIFYNSAALIGPAGVVGTYRKTHSFAGDHKWAKDGDLGLPVWETPLGRIGILICMDAGFFEPARLLALAGADVLCFPTNWLGEKTPGPAWSTRAFENGCYLIAADRYGLERGVQFTGGSCVLNPDGTIQAMQDTGDGIVYGQVSLAAARAKSFGVQGRSEKLVARRPELYDNLTLPGYVWEPMEFHSLYGHRPLPPGRRSRIAVGQFTPRPGDPAGNMALIEQALAELS
ncbi:MAG: nitrilase/cyanide hydratase and apolipoprotein N-acyltransferase, partial [Chloroflexota bacterium]|nr:nitrilase/cyanide hydratase and apolipoprotein N-acyltransferase [Chloroflexota bacterium]